MKGLKLSGPEKKAKYKAAKLAKKENAATADSQNAVEGWSPHAVLIEENYYCFLYDQDE